ncbi:MAG: hypothetical protein ACI89G_000541 [Minisyncoccia bacterium]|jgi:hypothetical protein
MSSESGDPASSLHLDFDQVDNGLLRRNAWSGRARGFVAIGILAVVAGTIPVAIHSGGDSKPTADVTEIVPLPTTPPAIETLPENLDEPATPTTIRPRPLAERLAKATPPRFELISIADELADIDPTEIVALQSNEGIFEISLPSGRVRITDLGYFAPQGTRVVVNDAGTLVFPTPEGGSQLIGIDRSIGGMNQPLGGVATAAASNAFITWPASLPPLENEVPQIITLRSPEETGDVSAGLSVRVAHWLAGSTPRALATPGGDLVVKDTGGSYLLAEDGTTRITSGDVVATGRNHLLLRECDQQLECSLASFDRNGFRTLWATDLPDGANPQQVNGLSPGGDALLINGDRLSADHPGELQVFELLDGAVASLRSSRNFGGFAAWANDSSGVFYADDQLMYVTRSGDRTVVVSADLPHLRALSTRAPARTPTCELIEVVLPRFRQMQNAPDGTVGPPRILILNRLIDLSPDELAAAVQPLVTFVGAFVSAETPDSQVVANWPAGVRSGLDALVTFDQTTC